MVKARGLGKGLSALMGELTLEEELRPDQAVNEVALDRIHPNPHQPRKHFSEDQLFELAASIQTSGILQPIVVRPLPEKEGEYQIIAGERRWRASQLAGMKTIPVIVRSFSDKESLEVALIENIQRQDLNPVEEAESYHYLLKEFNYTHETLANVVGKSRTHITNLLRLLQLPDRVKELVSLGTLAMGHARALINSERAIELAEMIVEKGLSVRQAEQLVKEPQTQAGTPSKSRAKVTVSKSTDEDISALEETLANSLGMKVNIEDTQEGGKMTIFFHNLEQLDMLLQRLSGTVQ